MLVRAHIGPSYPVIPSIREWRWGLDSALKLGPDHPDLLYEYGDVMWHFGRTIGIPDAINLGMEIFARAFARDSSFAPAIEHLVDDAANRGDKAEVTRLAARYLALDSAADHATYIRWRAAVATGDSAALRDVRKSFPAIDFDNARRIAGIAMLEGIGLGDADAVAPALGGVSGPNPGRSGDFSVSLALNRGRQRKARQIQQAEMQRTSNDPLSATRRLSHIIYWDADRSDAVDAAGILERHLRSSSATAPGAEGRVHIAACVLALWRLSNNDVKGTQEMIRILRKTLSASQTSGFVNTHPTCLPYLEAATRMRLEPGSTAATLSRLDALSLEGARDFYAVPFNIELARLFDMNGNPQKALEVMRRRPYHWADGIVYLTTQLRDEGRFAAKSGDNAGAIRAYSHYLRLRDKPDPELMSQADSVRAELRKLGVTPAPR